MRLSDKVTDYVGNGSIVDRQQVTAVGGELDFDLIYLPGTEEIYLNGVRLLSGASYDYITTPGGIRLNTPLVANDELLLIGKGDSLELPFGRAITEHQTLSSGQVVVTFTDIMTEDISIYLTGPGVDRGKLVSPRDYTITSSTTITLAGSYPAGTVIEGIQGGKVSNTSPSDFQVDDGTTTKSISLRFASTQESDTYFREKENLQILPLSIGMTLRREKKDATGDFIVDPSGNYPVVVYNKSSWSPNISGSNPLVVNAINITNDVMTLTVYDTVLDASTTALYNMRASGGGSSYSTMTAVDVSGSDTTPKVVSGKVVKDAVDSVFGDDAVFDAGISTTITVKSDDTGMSTINLVGDSQGTGRVFVGQSTLYGGGIEYSGDSSPTASGAGDDQVALFRRINGVDHWTARNAHNSNDWHFRGRVFTVDGEVTPSIPYSGSAMAGSGTSLTTSNGLNRHRVNMLEGLEVSASADEGTTWTDLLTVSDIALSYKGSDIYTTSNQPSYNNLKDKPTLFDGDYNSLSNTPSLFDGSYGNLTGIPSTFPPSDHTHTGYAASEHTHLHTINNVGDIMFGALVGKGSRDYTFNYGDVIDNNTFSNGVDLVPASMSDSGSAGIYIGVQAGDGSYSSPGRWKCLGYVYKSSEVARSNATLWQRIA